LYREQAKVLRRTAAVAQAIANAPRMDTLPTSVVKDTAIVSNKSKDEQIASLKDQLAKSKDELAKANAELDRIKKRLANPSN
jgi:molecular chaperone GrpE (heat shock protein)